MPASVQEEFIYFHSMIKPIFRLLAFTVTLKQTQRVTVYDRLRPPHRNRKLDFLFIATEDVMEVLGGRAQTEASQRMKRDWIKSTLSNGSRKRSDFVT